MRESTATPTRTPGDHERSLDELRAHLAAHRLRAAAVGDSLAFGAAATVAFEPSTVRRRALAAWGWKEVTNPDSGGPKLKLVKARPDALKPIGLHEARHTFALLMIAAGVNAKALATYMGHASVMITLDRYEHLMPGNEAEAAHLLDTYLSRATRQ